MLPGITTLTNTYVYIQKKDMVCYYKQPPQVIVGGRNFILSDSLWKAGVSSAASQLRAREVNQCGHANTKSH